MNQEIYRHLNNLKANADKDQKKAALLKVLLQVETRMHGSSFVAEVEMVVKEDPEIIDLLFEVITQTPHDDMNEPITVDNAVYLLSQHEAVTERLCLIALDTTASEVLRERATKALEWHSRSQQSAEMAVKTLGQLANNDHPLYVRIAAIHSLYTQAASPKLACDDSSIDARKELLKLANNSENPPEVEHAIAEICLERGMTFTHRFLMKEPLIRLSGSSQEGTSYYATWALIHHRYEGEDVITALRAQINNPSLREKVREALKRLNALPNSEN